MKYRVKTDTTELPKGSQFIVWPAEVEHGQLAAFAVHKDDTVLTIGRLFIFSGVLFIKQPSRWIACLDETPVRVLGVVIPCEESPEEIGYQVGDEHFYGSPQLRG
jgi:hypothetical protein